MVPSIFRYQPAWEGRFAYVELIEQPTPVQRLSLELDNCRSLFAKREDLTDSLYGGNKVRNCEFLLGDVLERGYRRVTTVAPLGSNFITALVAQAKRVGITVEVEHFTPVTTPQIQAHADFTRRLGAEITTYSGRIGAVPAGIVSLSKSALRDLPFLSPGGSHPIGVLGHISAMLEVGEQVAKGQLPEPEVLVVGVGTCGTLAGLLIGKALLGWGTQILAVRCVDKIICNPYKVDRLVRATVRRLGIELRIPFESIRMFDVGGEYGVANSDWQEVRESFLSDSRIYLDTTYTGKVASFLKGQLKAGRFRGKDVLYWHTYSPNAVLGAAERMVHENLLPIHLGETYVGEHVELVPSSVRAISIAELEERRGRVPRDCTQ